MEDARGGVTGKYGRKGWSKREREAMKQQTRGVLGREGGVNDNKARPRLGINKRENSARVQSPNLKSFDQFFFSAQSIMIYMMIFIFQKFETGAKTPETHPICTQSRALVLSATIHHPLLTVIRSAKQWL